MKPSELHSVWSAPDNSRLTAKQQSFRLPVHVAAKLSALCDLYPNKTKTQIVGDLLASAIDQSIEGLRSVKGPHLDTMTTDDGDELQLYRDVGPLARFKSRANEHFADLERELGNAEPAPLYPFEYERGDPDEPVAAFVFDDRGRP